ncbi:hypothetical protein [Flavobacterium sp. I3-2]|uniref:hypothetical protein n=1 Tax=Flavobacterium sp. I3-2 TaxID=2748319 RepID=UPI0015ADE520|nr:hypothetical protein [Flavobacterium sp. I3-2]
MGIFDSIKAIFSISESENKATKDKMKLFMKQALKKDNLDGFELVYGKLAENKDNLVVRKTEYHNYVIAFNRQSSELIILPIDPKLASCGWPIFINNETLKKAKTVMYGTAYSIDLKDGDNIMFSTPAQNYKIGRILGAMEVSIIQEKEVKSFKEFFNKKFKDN